MEKEIRIIQFELLDNGGIVILLNNGKMFRKTNYGGPWVWIQEDYLKECIEYFGKEKLYEW